MALIGLGLESPRSDRILDVGGFVDLHFIPRQHQLAAVFAFVLGLSLRLYRKEIVADVEVNVKNVSHQFLLRFQFAAARFAHEAVVRMLPPHVDVEILRMREYPGTKRAREISE